MAERGVAPGALVEVETGWSTSGVRLVRAFRWESLNHETQKCGHPHQAVIVNRVGDLSGRGFTGRVIQLPNHPELLNEGRGSKKFNVVGPVKVTAEQILAMAPEWFRKGEDGAKMTDVFDKDRTHVDHYENGFVS
jgi:hypothetical protein